MNVSQKMVTDSMRVHAEVLVSRSAKWAKGQRNRDGLPFFQFSSSRTTKDGKPIYHQTRADGGYCSCPSFEYRQACSHSLAAKMAAERAAFDAENDALFSGFEKYDVSEETPVLLGVASARQTAARRKMTYAEMYPVEAD